MRLQPAMTSHPLEWYEHNQSNQPSTRPTRSSKYNISHMYNIRERVAYIFPSSFRPTISLYFYVGDCPVVPAGARPYPCMCSYVLYISHDLFLCHTFFTVPETEKEEAAESSGKTGEGNRL